MQEGGSVTGTVASIQYRVSTIPEKGLEIPIQMTFSHTSKPIMEKNEAVCRIPIGENEPGVSPRRSWRKPWW